ncbi:metal-dependent hydrolase [Halosegnis sp.]|uniref:metal-dependent hydrolase n=1 Tax=Halosegnis sp. TaxID=2864959 RepID=UPI0035D4BED9
MPSTLVHVAFALLCAAGLLGDRFTRRAALAVAAATIIPDLDVFASLVVESTHRAALHNLFVPGVAALALRSRRGQQWLRGRFGPDAVAVAWVALFGYVVAGLGLDMFTPLGVNPLYSAVDQFVAVDGTVGYSTDGGVFQTFLETGETTNSDAGGGGTVDIGQRGSTKEVHVASGVDPEPGPESAADERLFPLVQRGWQVTLLLVGGLVTLARLRTTHEAGALSDER